MNETEQKLTLDQPATYQTKVPGHLDQNWADWADWAEGLTVMVDCDEDGLPFTTLTGRLDQAALHGLLRHLYALGLPLISVVCIDPLGN